MLARIPTPPATTRWANFTRRHPAWAAHAAAGWSACYGALGLLWALGAGGFPFGVGDPEAADMASLLVGARAETAGPVIAALGASGAVIAVAMAHVRPRRAAHRWLLAFAWVACGALVLLVPDVRLMRDFAYAFMFEFGKVDWPTVNQLLCIAGGALWGAAAVALRRRTDRHPRRRAANARVWHRWGPRVTLAAVLLPVPYEITRWAWAFGFPLGVSRGADTIEHATTQARIGMFVLGLLPMAGGILTHGLARPWGEIYPRWIPRKAGRRIHPAVAIVPGAIASILIITAGLVIFRQELNVRTGRVPEPDPDVEGWGAWLPAWFWLPWGVALAGATYAYAVRRLRPVS